MPEHLTARDLMVTEFARIGEDATLGEALSALLETPDGARTLRALPVVDAEGALSGMLPTGVLLKALVEGRSDEGVLSEDLVRTAAERLGGSVRDAMLGEVPVAALEDRLLRLMALTAGEKQECVPVIHENRLVGLVRLGDVFLAAAGLALAPRESSPEA